MKRFITFWLILILVMPVHGASKIGFRANQPIYFHQPLSFQPTLGIPTQPIINTSPAASSEPGFGKWRWANDYWGSQDKFIHYLFYGWMSKELADAFTTWGWKGAKWKAAGTTFIVAGLNEVKDGKTSWEEHGGAGGDGFSWWDLGFSTAGIAKTLIWPVAEAKPKSGKCSQPLSDLWPRLGTDALILTGWISGNIVYHIVVDGKAFPNGSGTWQEISGDQGSIEHVLFNFNTEISCLMPWYINAQLRPYLPLGYRNIITVGSLFTYEHVANGYLREGDILFLGDTGARFADIQLGICSMFVTDIYELWIYPKGAVCQPDFSYRVIPTYNGLAIQFNW